MAAGNAAAPAGRSRRKGRDNRQDLALPHGARPIGVTAARPRYRDGKAMLAALKPRLHRHGHQVPGQIGLVPNHLDGVDKNWSWQLSRGLRILCCNYRLSW
jgi:hypothetical protein